MVRNTDTGKKILEDIKGLKMLCFRLTVKAQWNKFFGCFDTRIFYVTLYMMPASHSKNVKGILESVLLLPAS